MSRFIILVVLMLVVGLVAGLGAGSMVFGGASTVTETVTGYLTILSTVASTEKVTETKVVPTTFYSTETVTVREVSTSTILRTTTSVSTLTLTVTETRRVYPPESEAILITDSGSGNKDTRPFTLDETSDLKITVKITPTADLKYVLFDWYLYIPGVEKWLKHATVEEDAGTFEFYAAKIPPGDYYVKVLAANCKWEISVEKIA